MKRLAIIVVIGLLAIIGYSLPNPVKAATNPYILVGMAFNAGNCQDSFYEVEFGWVSTDADDGQFDFVGVVVYDANGVRLAADWANGAVGIPMNWLAFFGQNTNPLFKGGMNEITARPVTIEMYDLYRSPPIDYNTNPVYDDILNQAATGAELMLTVEYDPANDQPDCASLPVIGSPPPPGTCDPCGPGDYGRVGQVMITAGQSQPGLTGPNGATAKATNGADIILPFDADGNGFDTYDVIDSTVVNGR
ncbi:MAG: hypothetical protein L0154_15200 [Chloroflexi bacterium]|nr:hypothetical protein [Chloroflexota bacterium]